MRVILKPTVRHAFSGVVKWKNCYDYLTPYYTRSGNTYTGLIKEDEERLGRILGLNLATSSPFWKDFFVRVGADEVFIDTNDPMDELKYLFLKNHKRVKTSIFEKKATADYLLINKDEEAKRENLVNKAKVDALFEFKKMTTSDMRKVLRLFGQNADNASGELVENTLFKVIESNPEMFLSKWVNNPYRETEVLLEQAVSRNIIRRNKNVYKYGTDIIANSSMDAIDFLNNPKNQDIKLAILKALDAKDYIAETGDLEEPESRKVIAPETKKPKQKIVTSGLPGEDDSAIDLSKIDLTE